MEIVHQWKGPPLTFVSYREYGRMRGIRLKSVQDRIARGSIPEAAIDRTNPKRPKINVEMADAEFERRRSMDVATSTLMQNNLPPDPMANKVANKTQAVSNGDVGVLDDKVELEKPRTEKIMRDGKEVTVTRLPGASADGFERYKDAKANSETIKARLLHLQLEEAEGRLVDVSDLKKEVQQLCTTIRENILNVPAKIAPELMSCANLVEVETKLYAELNLALSALSKLLESRAEGVELGSSDSK